MAPKSQPQPAAAAAQPAATSSAATPSSTTAAAEAGAGPSSSQPQAAVDSTARSAAAAALAAAKEAASVGVSRSYNKVQITETRRFAGKDIEVGRLADSQTGRFLLVAACFMLTENVNTMCCTRLQAALVRISIVALTCHHLHVCSIVLHCAAMLQLHMLRVVLARPGQTRGRSRQQGGSESSRAQTSAC